MVDVQRCSESTLSILNGSAPDSKCGRFGRIVAGVRRFRPASLRTDLRTKGLCKPESGVTSCHMLDIQATLSVELERAWMAPLDDQRHLSSFT